MINSLDVMIWGRKAGTLVTSGTNRDEKILFYFDPEFVQTGWDIAPLRASLKSNPATNGLPIFPESDKIFGGLPSFIADSLPDHWGNTLFNEWAKSKGIRPNKLSPLDRLAYIGRRGMGALEFYPSTSSDLELPFKVVIHELSMLAQKALNEAKSFHMTIRPDFAIESLFKVGTSAGGRRPKAVINVNLSSGECYSGQVQSPLPGFTPMIIKFDEHSDIPTTRIEYSYYLMAIHAGMKMMQSRLIESQNETHFLTERFDRRGNDKIHTQSLAALNPLATSYEDLIETALRLNTNPIGIKSLYLHMVMNIICGNVDDHNKNFSFIMEKDSKWDIAPAYDFTFTVDPSAPGYINRHCITLNNKTHDFTLQDLLSLAEKFSIKEASIIISKALSAARNYRQFAEKANVPEKWIQIIENEISERISQLDD